ncbi:thioesterase II family protein [Micromonospora lupini]|uniref:thioesterase II family protein n=1 Tax=Micromonospora lupini TaxID=285679 RepID=UPI0033DDD1D4
MSRYLLAAPDPAATVRLLCLHPAGSTARPFMTWRDRLGPGVDVLPIQLPGREARVNEPRIRDLAVLLEQLDGELGALLDEPYAFYGHSMGAMIAYSWARMRFETGRSRPLMVNVGACQPPGAPGTDRRTPGFFDRPDDELERMLVGIGGMSAALMSYPQWRDAAIALLRDDLALCEPRDLYGVGSETDPVDCPINIFTGAGDPIVTPEQMARWHRLTRAGGVVRELPGGHFFHQESRPLLLSYLRNLLAAASGRVAVV